MSELNTLILNDWHLSVKRVAGTTFATVSALHRRLQQELRSIMMDHLDVNVLFLGDLPIFGESLFAERSLKNLLLRFPEALHIAVTRFGAAAGVFGTKVEVDRSVGSLAYVKERNILGGTGQTVTTGHSLK